MTAESIPPSSLDALDAALQRLEREQSAQFEFQRRYNLLRIIVPTIFVLALLAIPSALVTDLSGPSGWRNIIAPNSSTAQVAVVLTGMTICSDFDTQMCSKALDAQSSLFLLH